MQYSLKQRISCFSVATLIFSSTVYADVPIASEKGLLIVASGMGEVVLTFQGTGPYTLFNNDLYLETANGSQYLVNNKASLPGSKINLGTFRPDTELKFRLHVNDTNSNYFTGSANRNPDIKAHARVQTNWKQRPEPNETLVSFEDSVDFLFNDLSFSLTNVTSYADRAFPVTNLPTIGKNLDIYIPSAAYIGPFGKTINLWMDLEYMPNSNGEHLFRLKDSGVNNEGS